MLCQIVLGPHFQNFNVAFNLLKGLGIFCCFTKISTHKKIVKTSLRLQQWETYFLKLFFKKWKETHKLIKQNNLKFSFWRLYVEVKGRYLQFKIIFIVKVTVIKKKKNFAVRAMHVHGRSTAMCRFSKIAKVLSHSTLLYTVAKGVTKFRFNFLVI